MKPTNKFGYLAKVYAGIGEYMVGKALVGKDEVFKMSTIDISKIGINAGVNIGIGFRFKCSTINAAMRIGYHYCFSPEYNGYDVTKEVDMKGWDIMPNLSYTVNF